MAYPINNEEEIRGSKQTTADSSVTPEQNGNAQEQTSTTDEASATPSWRDRMTSGIYGTKNPFEVKAPETPTNYKELQKASGIDVSTPQTDYQREQHEVELQKQQVIKDNDKALREQYKQLQGAEGLPKSYEEFADKMVSDESFSKKYNQMSEDINESNKVLNAQMVEGVKKAKEDQYDATHNYRTTYNPKTGEAIRTLHKEADGTYKDIKTGEVVKDLPVNPKELSAKMYADKIYPQVSAMFDAGQIEQASKIVADSLFSKGVENGGQGLAVPDEKTATETYNNVIQALYNQKINDITNESLAEIEAENKKQGDIASAEWASRHREANDLGENATAPMPGSIGVEMPGTRSEETIDAVTARYKARLEKLGITGKELESSIEGFKAQAINQLASLNTNEHIINSMTDKPWLRNILKTGADVLGGVNESTIGKTLLYNTEKTSYDRFVDELTNLQDQSSMGMGTQIFRGAVGFLADMPTYGFFGNTSKWMMSKAGGAIARVLETPAFSKFAVNRLINNGYTREMAWNMFQRAVNMNTKGRFFSNLLIGSANGALTFGQKDAMDGFLDAYAKPILPKEMESTTRYLLASMQDLGAYNTPEEAQKAFDDAMQKVDPTELALFGEQDAWKRFGFAMANAWDRGKWGFLSGASFIGSPFGDLIGRNRSLVYKLLGDVTKLGINATNMTAVQDLEQYVKTGKGMSGGEFGKAEITNVLNLGLLDGYGTIKRVKSIDMERAQERLSDWSDEYKALARQYHIPYGMDLVKQLADGTLNLPQPAEGKRVPTSKVQLFPRTKGADGKIVPLTPEQKAMEDQVNGFLANGDIPFTMRGEIATMLTGMGYALPLPTNTSAVRKVSQGDGYAVDLLDSRGNVITTHYYKDWEDASEGRHNLEQAITVANLADVTTDYNNRMAGNTFNSVILNDYDNLQKKRARIERAQKKMQHGGKKNLPNKERKAIEQGLSQHELDVLFVGDNAEMVVEMNRKKQAGEVLTPEETKLQETINRLYIDHMANADYLSQTIDEFEKANGLRKGEFEQIKKGHASKKEAQEEAGEDGDVVQMGDRYYTLDEMQILRDYRDMIADRVIRDENEKMTRIEESARQVVNDVMENSGVDPNEQNDDHTQTAVDALVDARSAGANMQGEQRKQTEEDYQFLQGQMATKLGCKPEEVDNALGFGNGSPADVFKTTNDELAKKYIIAREQHLGIMEALKNKVNAVAQEAQTEALQFVHKDGKVYRGVDKDNHVVYVTDGKLDIDNDGYVTASTSDKSITIKDVTTGETKIGSPEDLLIMSPAQEGDAFVSKYVEDKQNEALKQDEAELRSKVDFTLGNPVDVMVGDQMTKGTILADNGDSVVVDVNGQQATYRKDELQQMHEQAVSNEVLARHANDIEAQANDQQAEGQKVSQDLGSAPATPAVESPRAERTESTEIEPVYDEEGGIDVEHNTPADVYDYYHKRGMDNFADAELEQAKKDLAEAEAIKPEGSNAKERADAFAERNAKVKQAQDRVDFWNKVKDEPNRRNGVVAETTAPKESINGEEEVKDNTTPQLNVNADGAEKDEHNARVERVGGFLLNEDAEGIGGESATMLDSIGKEIGAKIYYDSSLIAKDEDGNILPAEYQANGMWIPSKEGPSIIRLNPMAIRPTSFVIGHEVTHHMKYTNDATTWDAYVNAVKGAMGEEFDRQFDILRKRYDAHTDANNLPRMSDDDIAEEVVSDYAGNRILSDKDFVKNLIDKVAESSDDPVTIAQRIQNFIDRILNAFKGIVNPTLAQRTQIQEMETAKELWKNMYEYASAKQRLNLSQHGSINDIVKADGEHSIDITPRRGKYNITTEEELKKAIADFADSKEAKRLGWNGEQVNAVTEEVSDLIHLVHETIKSDPNYEYFAEKHPTMVVDWRDGVERPIVTWVRNNIEYKYDMSADTFCINNEGLETVLASPTMADLMMHMARYTYDTKKKDEGHRSGFKSDDYLRLYETLRDMGFVVPCKGCFDAAARFKMLPSTAQNFIKLVNDTIDERNADPEAFDKALREAPGVKVPNGLPASASNKEYAVRVAVAGDNLTDHVNWTQLMSAQGQTQALSDWGGLFRAWQRTGAGRPKDKLMPEPYTGQIMVSASTIIAPYGEQTPSFRDMDVNQGTGLRRNSHSEYRPTLVVDEMQFMRDAWLKHLCVFKYMKELDDVRLFGNMGVKFNMSTFAAWYPDGTAAGLDKDGNYAIAEESVGGREFPYIGEDGRTHYDGYKGFEEAKKHVNKDCSLSAVAFSMPHLIKLLTDVPTPSDKSGTFGSLIPFHATGATAYSLRVQGLGSVRGLLSGSFFKEAFTDYNKGVTNFEDVQNDRFGKGWKCLAGSSAGKDVEDGHKIEFANGTIYRNDELGITLYSSPQTYKSFGGDMDVVSKVKLDKKGNVVKSKKGEETRTFTVSGNIYTLDSEDNKIAHELHIDYNDKFRELGGDYSYKEAADYYLDLLPKLGLRPRFDFDVPAEIYLKMCEDAHVDPNHPKLGWKGGNEPWSPAHAESYYSMFCDYGMTDPETGKLSPHRPVLDGQTDADAFEKALPDNYLQVVEDGVRRYTERKDAEDSKINGAIAEFCKRSIAEGKMNAEEIANILAEHGFSKEQIKEATGIDFDPDDDPNGGGAPGTDLSKAKFSLGVPYQGSKSKTGKDIVDVLPKGKRFVDLFSGGGAMTHAALLSGKYDTFHMNDKFPMGQDLFLGGMEGKYRDYNKDVTREEFYNGMQYTPEGLMASFNGNGRSYANVDKTGRDKKKEQIRRVQNLESLGEYRNKITSSADDYQNVPVQEGDVLYADIPYAGTGNTSYKKAGRFDMEAFTDWANKLNQPVYVSSFKAPEGFTEIWSSKELPSFRGGSRKVEKLFVQDKFADAEKARIAQGKGAMVAEPNEELPDSLEDDDVLKKVYDPSYLKDVESPNGQSLTPNANARLEMYEDPELNKARKAIKDMAVQMGGHPGDASNGAFQTSNGVRTTADEYKASAIANNMDGVLKNYRDILIERRDGGNQSKTRLAVFNETIADVDNAIKWYKEFGEGQHNKLGEHGEDGIKFSLNADQTKTDKFKDWFGDWENNPSGASKVVDENGKPLVVYHGTKGDFNVFESGRKGTRSVMGVPYDVESQGFFFSPDKSDAEEYGNQLNKGNGKARVVSAYLDMKHPADLSKLTNEAEETYREIVGMYPSERNPLEHDIEDWWEIADKQGDEYDIDLPKRLKELGYDGIIFAEKGGKKSYFVIEPTQIKSATDNNGDFDKNNPDIRYSLNADGTPDVTGKMRQRRGETDADFAQRKTDYQNLVVSNPEEARKRVTDEIRGMMDDQRMSAVSKSMLNQMLKEVRDADKDNLKKVIDDVHRTMNTLSSKALDREMNALTNFKVQKRNGRNMSVAKSVDNATRKAFEFLRGRLIEFKATDFDNEKRAINGELTKLYRENSFLIKQHDAETDPVKQADFERQIAENQTRIEDLKKQKNDVEDQIAQARKENDPINAQTVLDMISDLTSKKNDSITNGTEWTDDDEGQLVALHILNKRLHLDDLNGEITKLKLYNDDLAKKYSDCIENKDKNGAKSVQRDMDINQQMMDDILQQLVDAKREICNDMSGMIEEGRESLKDKIQVEQQRKSDIILGFWGDIANGKAAKLTQKEMDENKKLPKGFWGGVRRLRGLFGSFEYMAQHMSKNTLGKDSWFYRYFMDSDRGVMKAQSDYMEGVRLATKTMNDKMKEIFGDGFMKVVKNDQKVVDSPIEIVTGQDADGNDITEKTAMSKGQATYLYMVWKMPDGRAKLEKQGFTETSIEQAKDFIGEKNIEWADWVQNTYLPELRKKYNARYEEMYNTSLAQVENYVPLKIFSETRHQDVDVDQMMGQQTLNQKAGSLINRTHNLNPVDLLNSAYEVISEHVQNMEEWCALARVRQDLNYLLSSKAIRNTMNANEAGSHDRLIKAAQIATNCYRNEGTDASKYVNALTRGLAGANIAFRNTTALKQMLSVPAFFGYDINPKFWGHMLKNMGMQYLYHAPTFVATALTGGIIGKSAMDSATSSERTSKLARVALSGTMRWCIDNIPSFRNRVSKGSVGNVVLDEMLSQDDTKWQRFTSKLGQYGMAANGLVDAVTCAIGIKSIYDFKYNQSKSELEKQLKDGAITKEEFNTQLAEADRQAKMDADIYYNGTQQSNHPAFMAPIQMDGDVASKMFTLYKNSPLSYARKAVLPIQELAKTITNWKTLQESEARSIVQATGKTFDEAMDEANKHLIKSIFVNGLGLAIYGYGLNWLWNWGGKGLLGFMQEDDDDKSTLQTFAEKVSPFLNGVPLMDEAVAMTSAQEQNPLLVFDMFNRIANIVKKYNDGKDISKELTFEILNSASRVGVGVDLNTVGNVYLGFDHVVKEGFTGNKELLLDVMFLLNTPNSNRKQVARKVYMKYSPEEFYDAVVRAEKAQDAVNANYLQYVPGMTILSDKKAKDIIKEYNDAHMSDADKKKAEAKKANTNKEILLKYPSRTSLLNAYDEETDPVRKMHLEKAYLKMVETEDSTKLANDSTISQKFKADMAKRIKTSKTETEAEKSYWMKHKTSTDMQNELIIKQRLQQGKPYEDAWKALGKDSTPAGKAYHQKYKSILDGYNKAVLQNRYINKMKKNLADDKIVMSLDYLKKYKTLEDKQKALTKQIKDSLESTATSHR